MEELLWRVASMANPIFKGIEAEQDSVADWHWLTALPAPG